MLNKEPLFQAVLGSSGVGKSTYINQRLKQDNSYCLRTATTGIAAVNMDSLSGVASPTTINSALGYFNWEDLFPKVAKDKLYPRLKTIASMYNYIAIDECSMLSGLTLDLIYKAVTKYNDSTNNREQLGIILLGDPAQLPCVSNEENRLPVEPFFKAKCWDNFNVNYLTEVRRQTDKEFITALSYIRKGRPDLAVDWFIENVNFCKQIDYNFEGSTFFSTNLKVDQYNNKKLSELKETSKVYKAVVSGTASSLWKEIPEQIELKKGALVQCLTNNLPAGYANGDLAIVEEMYETKILIRLLRNKRLVYFPYTVIKNTPVGSYTSIGSIKCMKLRLAYACTIHRAQSLTLHSAQIKLGEPFLCRLSGAAYVALSRVRTKEGLRLIGTKDDFIKSVYLDPKYSPYIK